MRWLLVDPGTSWIDELIDSEIAIERRGRGANAEVTTCSPSFIC
jgi:hypothetical protein